MSEHKPLSSFQPVPLRRRHDGWTPERQIAFVEKLADCGSITAACKHVGMSRESVRKLRHSPFGRAFRDACDAALDCGYADVEEAAAERSKNGVARPIFYKGIQVGEWRHHDERMTMFLLRFRRRHRFGAGADDPFQPAKNSSVFGSEEECPFDPEEHFDGCLDSLEFAQEPEDCDDDERAGGAADPE